MNGRIVEGKAGSRKFALRKDSSSPALAVRELRLGFSRHASRLKGGGMVVLPGQRTVVLGRMFGLRPGRQRGSRPVRFGTGRSICEREIDPRSETRCSVDTAKHKAQQSTAQHSAAQGSSRREIRRVGKRSQATARE